MNASVKSIIANQINFNALSAIESVVMGFDTPLVDSEGLRGDIEAIKVAGKDAVMVEVREQRRALNKARNAAPVEVVGSFNMGGLVVPVEAARVVTVEQIARFR